MTTTPAPGDGVRPGPFSELLLRHRIVAGLSQHELARRSGLSERALRDLERGATARPRRQTLRTLAAALELTGADLATFLGTARRPAGPGGRPGDLDHPAALLRRPAGSGGLDRSPARPGGGGWDEPAGRATADRLVGRGDELRALVDLVTGGRHRLVTVTGPGGVGKSRLAAELVAVLHARTTTDVRTVDVAALTDPALVGEVIAEAYGWGGEARLSPADRLAAELRGRRAIVVVDGFERLVEAAPELAELVRRCTGLTVVTTSQRPLRVRGERQLRLEPLAPDHAVALFAARAAAARPGFTVDDTNRDAVAAVCRRVDALPLAIELAAARIRLLGPAELIDRLDRPLALLSGGGRDLPARQRSLRATIDSSLEVVGEDAAALFDWLAAYPAGAFPADLEALAAALGRDPSWILDPLAELIDMGLVRIAAGTEPSRYTLPDPMRELATERLAAGPDRDRVPRAVAVRLLGGLSCDPTGPRPGPCVAGALPDNLRASIDWAVAHEPHLIDVRVIETLFGYYELTGRLTEGQSALERLAPVSDPLAWIRAGQLARLRHRLGEATRLGRLALTHLPETDHAGRCTAHLMLGSVGNDLRTAREARRHLHAALVHARRAGDDGLLGRVLNNLGTQSMEQGRTRDAERLLGAALVAKRRHGADDLVLGRTLFNLAETALDAGRLQAAGEWAAEALSTLRAAGHGRLAGNAATTWALARLHSGDLDGAAAAAREATTLLGDSHDDLRATVLVGLRCSVVWHAAGERTTAVRTLRAVLPAAADSTRRDREEAADTLDLHAALLAARAPADAAVLLGAARHLRSDASRPTSVMVTARAEAATATARASLGRAAFDRWYGRGPILDTAGLLDLCATIDA